MFNVFKDLGFKVGHDYVLRTLALYTAAIEEVLSKYLKSSLWLRNGINTCR